jgi:hypothetical protein
MSGKPNPRWTPARTQFLVDNYKTMSANNIADHLGWGFTRNAVIGKAGRMGLHADVRLQPRREPTGELKNRKTKVSPRPRMTGVAPFVAPPKPKKRFGTVEIMELEQWHCRAIVGAMPTVYCGMEKIEASSYCLDHHRIYHVTVAANRVEKHFAGQND